MTTASPTLQPATPLQLVAVLPAGDWELVRFGDLIVAACPQHPPVVFNYIPDEVSNDT
jgi:hypothetical protein